MRLVCVLVGSAGDASVRSGWCLVAVLCQSRLWLCLGEKGLRMNDLSTKREIDR